LIPIPVWIAALAPTLAPPEQSHPANNQRKSNNHYCGCITPMVQPQYFHVLSHPDAK
jgi:hypothetical protein